MTKERRQGGDPVRVRAAHGSRSERTTDKGGTEMTKQTMTTQERNRLVHELILAVEDARGTLATVAEVVDAVSIEIGSVQWDETAVRVRNVVRRAAHLVADLDGLRRREEDR